MSEPVLERSVLERSVLERKERDELQTIAKAMGAVPTARARKADLVDLILSTAGITSAAGAEAVGGAEPESEPKLDDASTNEPVALPEITDHAEAAPAGEQLPLPVVDRADDDADGNVATSTNGHAPAVHGSEPGRPRDDDDGEQGNRRRRRRGRDRERGGERTDRDPRDPQPPRDREPARDPNRDTREGREPRPDDLADLEPVDVSGLLDLRDEGYGFLRTKGYLASRDDAYVSVKQARQFGLRRGDHITGQSRSANRNEKNPALLRVDTVNGRDPDAARRRPKFEDLTPLFPDERLRLETPSDVTNMTARIIDLISPIGKGQRGMIVSPPKAGKTTVLKQIVKSIEHNNPEVHLMVLLVDERPEEVTDMRRSTNGEVIASTFDRPAEEHIQVAELTLARAQRLVEEGRDVVIVCDGITRLARAYNLGGVASGRLTSGGIDQAAIYPPKRFFGAARNIEEGGSLTILATALVETGSRADDVIFEEFKGTGNMELRLDRRLAERRIYPAIDVDASSTRHEELLFDRKQLQQVWRVRRALNALSSADGASPAAALERLMDGMKQFGSNEEFLAEAAKASGPAGA